MGRLGMIHSSNSQQKMVEDDNGGGKTAMDVLD